MSLYEQISDEITLMDAGEQKWIGQDIPLESMMAVVLMLKDLDEEKVIKVRRQNREKTTGLKQVDRVLVEKGNLKGWINESEGASISRTGEH